MTRYISRRAVIAGCVGIGGSLAGCSVIQTNAPTVRWRYNALGAIGSPAIGDGTVYTGSTHTSCYAISLESGEKEWEFESLNSGLNGVTVWQGLIIGGNDRGSVYAIGVDGRKRWQTTLEGAVQCQQPLVIGETVLINARNGTVYGIDLMDGSIKWETPVVESIRDGWGDISARPILADGLAVVASYDDRVRAIDPSDGQIRWDVTVNGDIGTTVAQGQKLVAGSTHGEVVGIDPPSGEVLWRESLPSGVSADPACTDGQAYVPTEEDGLFALDVNDGSTVWKNETPVIGDVSANAGLVVFGTANERRLQALETDGSPRWQYSDSFRAGVSPPLITEKEVIVAGFDGYLHVIEHD